MIKISDKTYIIMLLVAITAIGSMGSRQFKEFRQSFGTVELPDFEIPEVNLGDFFPVEEEGYQEWASPDGALKLQYPSGWVELDEGMVDSFNQTGISSTEFKFIFFASSFNPEKQTSVVLTVNEFDQIKNLGEIIEIIKQDSQKQNGETEIVNTKTEGNIAWVEILSKYPDQPDFYSKAKLISTESKTYLIIFTAPQTSWSQFEEKANIILNSAFLSNLDK